MTTGQNYISPELIHFVGRGLTSDGDRYSLLCKILKSRELSAPPHSSLMYGNLIKDATKKFCSGQMFNPQVVCFCDIPINELSIHMSKYSQFGLSFPKQFLIRKGANPVFYLAQNSQVPDFWGATHKKEKIDEGLTRGIPWQDIYSSMSRSDYFDQLMPQYDHFFERLESILENTKTPESNALQMQVRDLRHFIDRHILSFIKCFDDQKTFDDPANFYMEREWRIIDNVQFTLDDVSNIFLPQQYITLLHKDVPDYHGKVKPTEDIIKSQLL